MARRKPYKYNGQVVPGMFHDGGEEHNKKEHPTGDTRLSHSHEYQMAENLRKTKEAQAKFQDYDHDAHDIRQKQKAAESMQRLKELGHILSFGLFRETGGSTGRGPNKIL